MSTMDDKPYLRWVPKYKQLRAQGLELEGISLQHAKVTVFSSNVWEDIRDRQAAFHADAETKARKALLQIKKDRPAMGKNRR
jgi:hypothetical protein